MTNLGTGNFRQVNKAFKNKRGSKQFKPLNNKAKKIKKEDKQNQMEIEFDEQTKQKTIKEEQKYIYLNSQILKQFEDNQKNQPETLIVLFCPLNNISNENLIVNLIKENFNNIQNSLLIKENFSQCSNQFLLELKNNKSQKRKLNYIFILCPRDEQVYLNYIKVADIQVNLTSMLNAKLEKLHLNAADNIQAFDEFGYQCLNLQRAIGGIQNLNLVFDSEKIPQKNQKDLKFYYKRQLEEEFPDSKTFFINDDIQTVNKFLLSFSQVSSNKPSWRQDRGYMLVDNFKIVNEQVYFSGIVKNSFSLNELMHLTNYNDLQPKEFYVLGKENVILQIQPQKQDQFEQTLSSQQIQQQQNEISDLQKQFEEINLIKQDKIDIENVEDNAEEDLSDDSEIQEQKNHIIKKEFLKLQKRDEADLDFEDEVEYEQDTQVRKRYCKYKYLQSFRTSNWNKYGEIPETFKLLGIIKEYAKQQRFVKDKKQKESIAFEGMRIIVWFDNIQLAQDLLNNRIQFPLILSSMYQYERNLNIQNTLVKYHNECEELIYSKQNYIVHSGFWVQKANIMFSQFDQNFDKNKYLRRIRPQQNKWHQASYYSQINMDFAPVIILSSIQQDKSNKILLIGNQTQPDPFKVILKRIILTGYPIKIKKKQAIVWYMFFNTEDINYYKPCEVYTKNGLVGNIKESLGTHGAMKAKFNGFMKLGDVVCLNLYKWVFPKYFY